MTSSRYSDYGSNDSNSSGNSGGDYDEDLTLKWKPLATFRGTLEAVFGAGSQYGQTFGAKWTDVTLVDGVLMRRLDENDNPDGTLKLFDWESMPILSDDVTADDAPEVHTEEIIGTTYKYELVAARVADNDDAGDPVPIEGNLVIWEGGNKSPSASAKSLAQLLTEAGKSVIDDPRDINNWLHTNRCDIREEMEGREFDVFKVIKDGDEHQFHSPVVIDTKTGEQALINSNVSDSGSGATDDTDDTTTTDTTANGNADPATFPEPVTDFIEFCVDFDLSDEKQIVDNMTDMASDSNNSLTPSMIQAAGQENIVSTIHEQQ